MNKCLNEIIDSEKTKQKLMKANCSRSPDRIASHKPLDNFISDPDILDRLVLNARHRAAQLQAEYLSVQKQIDKSQDTHLQQELLTKIHKIDEETKTLSIEIGSKEVQQKFRNHQFKFQRVQKDKDQEQEAYNLLTENDYFKIEAESI